MDLFETKNVATGREYWKLKRIERQKQFLFFVMAEMVLVAAAVLCGLIGNKNGTGRIVFDIYFILLLIFSVVAVLIAGMFLLTFYWYGYRPVKDSSVRISADDMTFQADVVGFSGRTKRLNATIRYCVDNGVYTKIGLNKRYFVWVRDQDLKMEEKKTIASIIAKLQEKKNKERAAKEE